MNLLADRIRSLAQHAPEGQLAALAATIADCASPAAALGPLGKVSPPVIRDRAVSLVKAWQIEQPGLAGDAIALALLSAGAASTATQAGLSLEPVWTGPATTDIPVRQTGSALLELVASAQQRLILVSFAAYKLPHLLDALHDAAAHGVDIRLVLETVADSGSALTVDAGHAFDQVRSIASFWVWPLSRRPAGAKLHAKAAIADESAAFVGSANLTGAALDHNMELGILVRGGSIPRRLSRHFLALMDKGELERTA